MRTRSGFGPIVVVVEGLVLTGVPPRSGRSRRHPLPRRSRGTPPMCWAWWRPAGPSYSSASLWSQACALPRTLDPRVPMWQPGAKGREGYEDASASSRSLHLRQVDP